MARASLTVRMNSAPLQRKLRDARGRYAKAGTRGAIAAHTEAAVLVQEQMQQVLDERVRQREAETGYVSGEARVGGEGRLRAALVDEGNRTVGTGGFTAGVPGYLDRSPAAPYWRNLEEGTSMFVGRQLVAFGPRGERPFALRDAPGWAARSRRMVTVQSAIPAYGYLEKGAERGRNMLRQRMLGIYQRHLRQYGIDLTDVPLRRSAGSRFG